MQSAEFLPLPRGRENTYLDIPFYRIPSALTILFNFDSPTVLQGVYILFGSKNRLCHSAGVEKCSAHLQHSSPVQ